MSNSYKYQVGCTCQNQQSCYCQKRSNASNVKIISSLNNEISETKGQPQCCDTPQSNSQIFYQHNYNSVGNLHDKRYMTQQKFHTETVPLICNYDGHEQKIILICLSRNCDICRLCCSICLNQFHNDHAKELVDLNQYVQQYQQVIQKFSQTKEKLQTIFSSIHGLVGQINQLNIDINPQFDSMNLSQINIQAGQLIKVKQMDQYINDFMSNEYQFLEDIKQVSQSIKGFLTSKNKNLEQSIFISKQMNENQSLIFKLQDKEKQILKLQENIQQVNSEQRATLQSFQEFKSELEQQYQNQVNKQEKEKIQYKYQISQLMEQLQNTQKYNERLNQSNSQLINENKQLNEQIQIQINEISKVPRTPYNMISQVGNLEKQQTNTGSSNKEQSTGAGFSQRIKCLMEKVELAECLFLTDVQQMDRISQQVIIEITRGSSQMIIEKTGRKSFWGAILYRNKLLQTSCFSDTAEFLEQYFSSYQEQSLQNSQNVDNLQEALLAATQLIWKEKTKVALIFPTFNSSFDHQVQDILQVLIDKQIVLLGIRYQNQCHSLFDNLSLFYQRLKKPQMYCTLEIKQLNKISEIITNITDIIEKLVKTNIQAARMKTQPAYLQDIGSNQIPEQLIKTQSTVQFKCVAFKLRLNHGVFENKKENIQDIKFEDFSLLKENIWNCVRTEQFYCQSERSNIFVMKKLEEDHDYYVLKVPKETGAFRDIQKAVLYCKSHLIAKSFMNEFIHTVKENQFNSNYPYISFTGLLLLEDTSTRYWIAEKFMRGNFKRYNKNTGSLITENDQLNQLCQAFSLYTYLESGLNYIICGIKSNGNYFTFPDINSFKGDYDENDRGETAILRYLRKIQEHKGLIKELLQSIGIRIPQLE